jgi:hypothetical protein
MGKKVKELPEGVRELTGLERFGIFTCLSLIGLIALDSDIPGCTRALTNLIHIAR